jgi:hypothetical protein
MMEAASISETSVNFYHTTRRNIPQDTHLHTRRRYNLKYYLVHIIKLLTMKFSPYSCYFLPLGSNYSEQHALKHPQPVSFSQSVKPISIFYILFWCYYTSIREQRFCHTQYVYIINNIKLNSGQHVSITQDQLQALVDIFLILKQSYM